MGSFNYSLTILDTSCVEQKDKERVVSAVNIEHEKLYNNGEPFEKGDSDSLKLLDLSFIDILVLPDCGSKSGWDERSKFEQLQDRVLQIPKNICGLHVVECALGGEWTAPQISKTCVSSSKKPVSKRTVAPSSIYAHQEEFENSEGRLDGTVPGVFQALSDGAQKAPTTIVVVFAGLTLFDTETAQKIGSKDVSKLEAFMNLEEQLQKVLKDDPVFHKFVLSQPYVNQNRTGALVVKSEYGEPIDEVVLIKIYKEMLGILSDNFYGFGSSSNFLMLGANDTGYFNITKNLEVDEEDYQTSFDSWNARADALILRKELLDKIPENTELGNAIKKL